jgi:hypothetical protein
LSIVRYIDGLSIDAFEPPAGQIVTRGGTRTRSKAGTHTLRGAAEAETRPTAIGEKLAAAVNAGSILSFVDGVESQERSDILFSVQFAQRAADASYDRFAESRTWYGKFNELLEVVGWTTEQYAFHGHAQAEGNLRMDKAALGVITAIATGNQLQAITASIAALEKLADNDNAITLFDHYATTDLSGNFQIGAVQKGESGSLSMALGAFYFRTTARRKKFLFFQWGSNEVNFWTAAQKMTFNAKVYSQLRSNIEKKLGRQALEYVAAIDIR